MDKSINGYKNDAYGNGTKVHVNIDSKIFLERYYLNEDKQMTISEMMKLWGYGQFYKPMIATLKDKIGKGEFCTVTNLGEWTKPERGTERRLVYSIIKDDRTTYYGNISFFGSKMEFVNGQRLY